MVKAIVNWAGSEKNVIDAAGWHDAKGASEALKQARRLIHALQHDPRHTLPHCVNEVEVAPSAMRIHLLA